MLTNAKEFVTICLVAKQTYKKMWVFARCHTESMPHRGGRRTRANTLNFYMTKANTIFSKLTIRMMGLLLALATLVGCGALLMSPAAALASDDYTQWKQGDEEWNESPAWPGGWSSFLSSGGCWVTSISMLLRQYGLVSGDVDEFNPWICCGILAENGALNGNGDMVLSRLGDAFPGFSYVGDCDYSLEALKEKLAEGYACSVLVNYGGHMVAVRGILEDGTVVVMDPGSDRTTLDEFGDSAVTIMYFGPVRSAAETLEAAPQNTPAVS